MAKALRIAASSVGLIAAGIWFSSAITPIPDLPGAAMGSTAPSAPFNVLMHQAALLNAWAAGMTAVSIVFAAVSEFF